MTEGENGVYMFIEAFAPMLYKYAFVAIAAVLVGAIVLGILWKLKK